MKLIRQFAKQLANYSLTALLVSITACNAASSAPRSRNSSTSQPRTYVTHLPNNRQPTQPVPLVLVFHGYGSQGKDLAKSSGLNQIADLENFIVVYPDGLDRRWNVGGDEDVAFTSSIIQQFQRRYKVDPRRIYAAGVSNGGFLVQRLACEPSSQITAFASIVAAFPKGLQSQCQPNRPIPMLMINGTDDRKVPWNGGALPYGQILSVPSSISYWRQHNQCPGSAKIRSINPRVQIDQYTNCKNGSEVELVTLKGAGHVFPRGGGGANSLIDASREVLSFFGRHRSR